MTYREYLKSNGASDADIAILDTPVAQNAYTKMEARLAEESRLRTIAETDKSNYQKWYDEQALPAYETMQQTVVKTQADLARARAAVLAARDQGLADVAKAAGFDVDAPPDKTTATTDKTTPVDTSKFATVDTLREFAEQAGNGLADLQDLVIDFQSLFPNQRLNVSQMRKEAVAAKKNIRQYVEEKFNMAGARQAAEAAAQKAHDDKLIEQGRSEERARYADQANPNLRPGVSSNSPFTQRTDRDRTKQPWETGDRTGDRVANATRKLLEQSVQRTN